MIFIKHRGTIIVPLLSRYIVKMIRSAGITIDLVLLAGGVRY